MHTCSSFVKWNFKQKSFNQKQSKLIWGCMLMVKCFKMKSQKWAEGGFVVRTNVAAPSAVVAMSKKFQQQTCFNPIKVHFLFLGKLDFFFLRSFSFFSTSFSQFNCFICRAWHRSNPSPPLRRPSSEPVSLVEPSRVREWLKMESCECC